MTHFQLLSVFCSPVATGNVCSSVVAPSCLAPRYKNSLFMLQKQLCALQNLEQICRLLSVFCSVQGSGRFVSSGLKMETCDLTLTPLTWKI